MISFIGMSRRIHLEYAPWEHVYSYLCKYASLFDITSRIYFRARVLSISKANLRDADQPWSIKVEQTTGISSSIETLSFDFVVIASGLFFTLSNACVSR